MAEITDFAPQTPQTEAIDENVQLLREGMRNGLAGLALATEVDNFMDATKSIDEVGKYATAVVAGTALAGAGALGVATANASKANLPSVASMKKNCKVVAVLKRFEGVETINKPNIKARIEYDELYRTSPAFPIMYKWSLKGAKLCGIAQLTITQKKTEQPTPLAPTKRTKTSGEYIDLSRMPGHTPNSVSRLYIYATKTAR